VQQGLGRAVGQRTRYPGFDYLVHQEQACAKCQELEGRPLVDRAVVEGREQACQDVEEEQRITRYPDQLGGIQPATHQLDHNKGTPRTQENQFREGWFEG
jgi:hypothetical protein